ncbi:MAG: PKD domain-containing protein [Halobacteriota archaeon]|nr:PKD domain-containing protein [Halobacteriota archaeon]
MGDRLISLKVTDSFGAVDVENTTVMVMNVAPTVEAGPDQTANEGDTFSFSGTFTDPSSSDTHTIEWDFGDGSNETGTLTPNHVYIEDGVYTVTLLLQMMVVESE